MTNHSCVPRSLWEMTSDRMASSVARPPALRMTWASPSARPAYLAGSSRASMQVRIANRRAGGRGQLPFLAKPRTYAALAAATPPTIFDIARLLDTNSGLVPSAPVRPSIALYIYGHNRLRLTESL